VSGSFRPVPRPKRELAPHVPAAAIDAEEVVRAFLNRHKKTTVAAYRADLDRFGAYLTESAGLETASDFLRLDAGRAKLLARSWVQSMNAEGYAPATVNRRISSVRSLVDLAYEMNVVTWTLKTKGPKSEAYRDTAGPDLETVNKILEHVDRKVSPKGLRDAAIVRLLFGLALRRAEVLTLDYEHVDFDNETLWIMGKRRNEREKMTLTREIVRALNHWIAVRGTKPGPLFVPITRGGRVKNMNRLDGADVRRLVSQIGTELGIHLWPHALRHSSITAALDATDGNIRDVQAFARHKDPRTTMKYDDNRKDAKGEVAKRLESYREDMGQEEEE
jgi:integrase/recombinase XerC